MLETIIYLILTLITIYILGYGVTFCLLPNKLKLYILWLIPWVFILLTIVISTLFSLLGLSVSFTAPFLSTIYFVLSAYIYLKEKPHILISRENSVMFFIIFMNIIFNIIPILRREGILTTISLGNNDVIAYATAADYLMNHSLQESFHTKVLLTLSNLLHDGYRWGPSILTAFFMSIFRLQGYQLAYLIQAILFGLTIPLIYVLLRVLYKPSFWGMLLSTTMFAFNANLLYILYHNFFGQVLFWGIEMMLFILFFTYYGTAEEHKLRINRFDILISLTISALYFSYHEPAMFIFAPLVLYIFWRFLSKNQPVSFIKKLFLTATITLSISSVSILNAFIVDFGQSFGSNKDQPIGWELFRQQIPYANPYEALGFYSIHSFPPLPNSIAILLSLLVLFLISWGIFKSKQKNFIICFTLIFFFFYYWTGIVHHNFFAYNRAITYTLPFFIILFTVGLLEIFKKWLYQISLVIILAGLVMFSAIKLNKKFRSSYIAVDKSIVSLREVSLQNISEPIYVESFVEPTVPHWLQNWTGYFIYQTDVNQLPKRFNDTSSINKVPENSLVLIGKYSRWYYPPKRILSNIIWENEYYKIGRLCNRDECLKRVEEDLSSLIVGKNDWENVLLTNGWSVREGDERWTNSLMPSLRLVKKTPASKITIDAQSLVEQQTMRIFVNDKQVGEIQLTTKWAVYSFPIENSTDGIYRIKFNFDNLNSPDELELNTDTGSISAGFRSFTIE